MSGITISQETIGPELAAKYLAMNSHNRILNDSRVALLARDIANGNWVFNGESIKFGDDGLIDGQHRLQAIVESGKPIETVVVRGLSASAQETVDRGAKRTVSDILKINGEKYTAVLAAAIRFVWMIDTYGKPITTPALYPTAKTLTDYLAAHPDLRDSSALGYQANVSTLRLPSSVSAALHYMERRIDPDKADLFWDTLLQNDAPKGDPIYALRETALRDLGRPHRMSTTHKAALLIKTWNFWLEGRTGMEHVYWRPAGSGAEGFPTLVNPEKP
jgi:hypothetical protein